MKKYLLFGCVCYLVMLGAQAQTTSLYLETFDSSTLALPGGWTTSASTGTVAWEVSTSNASTGLYTGASGGTSIKIDNQDAATGTYSLISKSISTLGQGSITVSWGARLTTNFPPSAISPMVYYSTNNGASWTGVSYTEQSSASAWKLNGPVNMTSAVDNQASVKFMLVANITAAASGTYRIDDFQVKGTATNTTVTGIKAIAASQAIESYVADKTLYFNSKDQNTGVNAVKVFDITGKPVVNKTFVRETEAKLGLSELTNGIYIIRFELDNNQVLTKKVVLFN